MKAMDKARELLKKGLVATKSFAHRAGNKAIDLGDMGALKIESSQLKVRARKLVESLGEEVYSALVDLNHITVSRETNSIRALLDEIKGVRAELRLKEKEYHSIGDKAHTA